MKRISFFFSALLIAGMATAGTGQGEPTKATSTTQAVDKLPNVSNEAFAPGEMLEWRVHYGFVDAGIARISVEESAHKIGDREL